jgi:hypothetical protein
MYHYRVAVVAIFPSFRSMCYPGGVNGATNVERDNRHYISTTAGATEYVAGGPLFL